MMKGAALFDTMAQGVQSQCQKSLAQAREEAEAIVAESKSRAAAQRTSALDAARHENTVLDERWRLKAEAESIKAALAMKKDAVNEVIAAVERKIDDTVSGPNFPKVLDSLLAELMAAADADVVVHAPQAHVAHVRSWLGSHGYGTLEVEGSAAMRDGVAVQDRAQTYRISNTLSGRYNRVEQETRRVCMTGLFGESSAGTLQ